MAYFAVVPMSLRGGAPYPPASKPSGVEAGAEPIGAQDKC